MLIGFTLIIIIGIIYSLVASTISRIQEENNRKQSAIRTEQEHEIAHYKELNKQLEKKIKNSIPDYVSAKSELKNIATHEIRDKFFLPTKKLLDKEYDLNEMYLCSANGRLGEALISNLQIEDYSLSATIKKENLFLPSHPEIYHTSLRECDCDEFKNTRMPCKHIIFLAYTHGILQTNQENCKNHKDSLIEELAELSQKKYSMQAYIDKLLSNADEGEKYVKKLHNESVSLQNKIENLKTTINVDTEILRSYAESLSKDNAKYIKEIANNSRVLSNITFISKVLPEYQTLHYQVAYNYLLNKSHPAESAAETVLTLKRETKKHLEELNTYKLKLTYLESLYPDITEIFDKENFKFEAEENTDSVSSFVSNEEYSRLSSTERNQLALDRYLERRKSNEEIGRDYEMYVGYRLECRGYQVQYNGIIKKLEDMGRDLIATKGNNTLIVQCKNWSQEKNIYEKHIFQLYGTLQLYKHDNPLFEATGVFITTTKLSDKARDIANVFNIKIVEQLPLGDFPRIKCNINRTTGEKIYHLPFDQQYDTTVINKKDGELYAFTVKEAEEKGFRHAWKHFTN